MNTLLRKILLVTLVCFITGVSFSQKNQIAKANKEFDRFSYIDAREIYLKVVEDGYKSAEIYQKLGDTYYWNSDYDNAAKWYSKLITEFPNEAEAEYYYRASQSLKSLKKYDEADKMMLGFAAKGGNGLLLKNFEKDPNYLKSIGLVSKAYILEKVSVNTDYSDFGPSFYGDNKLVYATSSNKSEGFRIYEWNQQPFLDLFMADIDEEGKLSNPRSLSKEINTTYHESSTSFSKDGKTVYFTRNNFINGKSGKDKDKTIRLKLYKATNNGDGKWGDIVELPFNSKEYSVAHPALSPDEKRLYFSSDMPGTIGMSDLWFVDIIGDNTYGVPVNLGDQINTEARESFPYISKEGNLYYATDGLAGLGGYDIYVTKLNEDGTTGDITNLGEPINSNQDDFGFVLNESKGLGYLSSNRDGEKGSIDDDIYRIQEKCVIELIGTVFDENSKELIPGAEVTLLDENNKVINTIIVGEDAAYNFTVECSTTYSVRGTHEDYKPNEKIVTTPDKTGQIVVPIPLQRKGCPPNDLGCILCLQPIFFDFDRYNIRPDAEIELAKILAAMVKYPQLIIDIESHTDSRGSFSYNDGLSEKRAQASRSWLISKGIASSRLTAKGYGERQLLNRCVMFGECGNEIGTYDCTQEQLNNIKCSDGIKCSEAEHQLNRRSMFLIQN
ncbi:OmpA family protein [Ulvibacter antarcticus]|uniref:WD40 repeat protein n=1 Tax=Ulvibacter antarcticus TaxID=442714 RepID=A0A3L9YCP9_9FLAO|nr:OmpA family protein [Ulvibacter antarcticus]RMA58456.1 WD40 repeat protein [Ulvibacter antarcticus]